MATIAERLELFGDIRAAARVRGRSYVQQYRDLKRMKSESSTLGATDYFMYRLYEPDIWQREGGPRHFAGWRLHRPLSFALNSREHCSLAWDKLTFYAFARSAGIPTPRLQAIYLPPDNKAEKATAPATLYSLEDLRALLSGDAEYPLYAKPSYCQQARLGARIEAYDGEADAVRLTDRGAMPLADYFAEHVLSTEEPRYYRPEYGFIFQSALKPHAEISAITGNDSLSGCRIVVANPDEGPEVVAALQKLVKAGNSIDNFRYGRLGNLLAGVDPANGIVDFIINAFGPAGDRLNSHPVTGRSIAGRPLPGWNRLTDLCREATRAIPEMHLLHWDVALTPDGPVILELNDMGLVTFLQSFGHGLLREPLCRALHQYADPDQNPWMAELPY